MRAAIIASGAAAALATGGCIGIYGEISDLEDSTVVHESSRPDDIASDDYAIQLVFGGSGGEGVKVTVLGSGPGGVVNLRYDRGGELSSSGVQLGSDFNDINASVPVASFPPRFASNDSIAIGLPIANGGGRVALFSNSASQIDTKQYRVDAVPVGVGLGLTNAAAGAADPPTEPDMVVASGQEVRLFASYPEVESATNAPPLANTFTCSVAEPLLNAHVGDIIVEPDPGPSFDEVAIASAGVVRVIDGATIEAQSQAAADCFAGGARIEITAPNGETDFGQRILTADLNNSGVDDLVITAPSSQRVYVYTDLIDGLAPEPLVLTGEGGFGAAIAVGDLDADGLLELAVGAPTATANDVVGAGQVHVFDIIDDMTAQGVDPPLSLADGETNGEFGRALTVARFDDVDDLLVVGGAGKVFVYFQHPLGNDTDPRQ